MNSHPCDLRSVLCSKFKARLRGRSPLISAVGSPVDLDFSSHRNPFDRPPFRNFCRASATNAIRDRREKGTPRRGLLVTRRPGARVRESRPEITVAPRNASARSVGRRRTTCLRIKMLHSPRSRAVGPLFSGIIRVSMLWAASRSFL